VYFIAFLAMPGGVWPRFFPLLRIPGESSFVCLFFFNEISIERNKKLSSYGTIESRDGCLVFDSSRFQNHRRRVERIASFEIRITFSNGADATAASVRFGVRRTANRDGDPLSCVQKHSWYTVRRVKRNRFETRHHRISRNFTPPGMETTVAGSLFADRTV